MQLSNGAEQLLTDVLDERLARFLQQIVYFTLGVEQILLGVQRSVQNEVEKRVVSVQTKEFVLLLQQIVGRLSELAEVQLNLNNAELDVKWSDLFTQN